MPGAGGQHRLRGHEEVFYGLESGDQVERRRAVKCTIQDNAINKVENQRDNRRDKIILNY